VFIQFHPKGAMITYPPPSPRNLAITALEVSKILRRFLQDSQTFPEEINARVQQALYYGFEPAGCIWPVLLAFGISPTGLIQHSGD
jgi:hypothetical protein